VPASASGRNSARVPTVMCAPPSSTTIRPPNRTHATQAVASFFSETMPTSVARGAAGAFIPLG